MYRGKSAQFRIQCIQRFIETPYSLLKKCGPFFRGGYRTSGFLSMFFNGYHKYLGITRHLSCVYCCLFIRDVGKNNVPAGGYPHK